MIGSTNVPNDPSMLSHDHSINTIAPLLPILEHDVLACDIPTSIPCVCDTDEHTDDEFVVCHDCGCTTSASHAITWEGWDFDESLGDAPLVICDACQKSPAHRERVRDDQASYEQFLDAHDPDIYDTLSEYDRIQHP